MIRCIHGRGTQTSACDRGGNTGGPPFEDDGRSLRFEAEPSDGIYGCFGCSMGREDHEENRWRISAVTQSLGLDELDTTGGGLVSGLVAVHGRRTITSCLPLTREQRTKAAESPHL